MTYMLTDQEGQDLGTFPSLHAAKQAAPAVEDWRTVETEFGWNGWLPDAEPLSDPAFAITLDIVTADDPAYREVLCKTIELFDGKVEDGDRQPTVNCSEIAADLDLPYPAVAEWLRLHRLAGHIDHKRTGDDTMSVVLGIDASGRDLCK